MAKEHILAIEDDENILELIVFNLKKEGFKVTGVTSGEAGLDAVRQQQPHLVLLDLMLPGIDGLDVCKQLKNDSRTQEIPIIMLTAKGEETDIVAGLELGADDYITKPFSHRVLNARIKTVMRRNGDTAPSEADSLTIHNLTIDPGRHEVRLGDHQLTLTLTEFRLLHLLARRPGWVFTRNQIVNSVHGADYPVTERSVDVQVAGLRRKLGDAGRFIETVRGIGYRFKD